MSQPDQDQPFAGPDPRLGQQSVPAQPQPYLPPRAYWQPSPPAPKHNNGLAIAAVVVSSLVLLTGLVFVVSQVLFGILFVGFMSSAGGFSPPEEGLKGTAPQVVAGQTYPGALLQGEVARVVRGWGGDVTSMSCPASVDRGSGGGDRVPRVVDGSNWSFRVTFEDGSGHFTLDEKVS
jgi:hypothetical protein